MFIAWQCPVIGTKLELVCKGSEWSHYFTSGYIPFGWMPLQNNNSLLPLICDRLGYTKDHMTLFNTVKFSHFLWTWLQWAQSGILIFLSTIQCTNTASNLWGFFYFEKQQSFNGWENIEIFHFFRANPSQYLKAICHILWSNLFNCARQWMPCN